MHHHEHLSIENISECLGGVGRSRTLGVPFASLSRHFCSSSAHVFILDCV